MTSQVKYPIRLKLFLLISGFILFSTAIYLFLAIKVFKEDKTELIYEINVNSVKTMAAEVDTFLSKEIDKVKLLTQGYRDARWIQSVLESEPDLITYELFQFKNDWQSVSKIGNESFLKLYQISSGDLEKGKQENPPPLTRIMAENKVWVKGYSVGQGLQILTVAIPVVLQLESSKLVPHAAVIQIRTEKIQKLISGNKLNTVYLVDSEGKLAVTPSEFKLGSINELPLLPEIRNSPVNFQVRKFPWRQQQWLGAFAKVSEGGLAIISQIPEDEAFRASFELLRKTIVFAFLVLSCSMLASRWIARSLTEPLQRLLQATNKLAKWEFGKTIHVKTQDEVAQLARAFNSLATDLENQRKQLDQNQEELEKRVSERTSALQKEKKKVSETQEILVRTTRLASLGELAGAAAHEVLNPLNNMNIRIEKMNRMNDGEEKSDLDLLDQILQDWNRAFSTGGVPALEAEFNKLTQDGSRLLIAEDLENLTSIAKTLKSRSTEKAENFSFLAKEIVRITRIVNNMRSLSRVGGERRPVDIHTPIEETFLAFHDLFQKNKVELIKDFSADPRDQFSVVADKDELIQVFSNLIRNALYAVLEAKRRAGMVRISTLRVKNRVEVRIIDNGTGISKENLKKLFEANFTTKSAEQGTGLGLSISRRLVRAFGGDIEIEDSQEGQGTTFLIWFPAAG